MAAAARELTAALEGRVGKLLTLCVPAAAGVLLFAVLTILLRLPEAAVVTGAVKRFLHRG